MPLAPGRYRLNMVAKDMIAGNMNNYEVALDVPHFEEEKLASSSLILADTIEKLPTKSIGGGDVRDRRHQSASARGRQVPDARLRKAARWMRRSEFTSRFTTSRPDEKTQKPNAVDRVRDRQGGCEREKVLRVSRRPDEDSRMRRRTR